MPYLAPLMLFLGFVANQALADPLTVWNHAYQENYNADVWDVIGTKARNAYVLLEPHEDVVKEDWQSYVAGLKSRGNQVSAYMSIGTGERWRSDFEQLEPALVDTPWEDWPGERFIDRVDDEVVQIMKDRIDRLAFIGFDWIEFDNMDWAFDAENRSKYKFRVTEQESLDYASALCGYAHSAGLKCMAKNMIEGLPMFDGATYESFEDNLDWWNTDAAMGLVSSGKPMLIIHYDSDHCTDILSFYEAIYGPEIWFLCEARASNGYVRLPR